METKKMNEKESLELIAQMIQQTKQRISKSWGFSFLLAGYSTAIVAIAIYTLNYIASNQWWNLGWALLFLLWPIGVYLDKKYKPDVITYIDAIVNKVWSVINIVMTSTFFVVMALIPIGMILFGISGSVSGYTMMPLVVLFLGIGVSITGAIIKERAITYLPLIGIAIAVYMLVSRDYQNTYLYFGLSLLPIIIIPGHILNRKARKQC